MTTTVKFELAQLLKEKGFDVPTLSFYFKNGAKGNGGIPFNWNHYKHKDSDFSAPTISEVCMWFYEKHGIWIWVDTSSIRKWVYYINLIDKNEYLDSDSTACGELYFNSLTEAYEDAIEYVLKNLNLTNETNNNK